MGPEAIGMEGGEIYEPGKIKEMPDCVYIGSDYAD